jgi:hypothetical protein
MRAVRGLLVAAGVACGLWGLWLMRDFTGEQLRSTGLWLAGGVILHDVVVAPIVVVLGVVAARLLPGRLRAPAALAFLVWATLTVAFFPVLSGEGGKPGNDTILGRPYLLSWAVMTTVLVALAIVSGMRRSRGRTRQRRPTRAS